MIGKSGGERSKAGTYWSITTGEFVTLPKADGVLPGDRGTRWLRTPLPLAMMLGPLMGLGYIVFLPFIGIVIVAYFLSRKLVGLLEKMGKATIQVATPNWVPGVSYLLTKRRARPKEESPLTEASEKPEGEGRLTTLEKEIETRRRRGEK